MRVYDDAEYANSRLVESIVLLAGEPVYVTALNLDGIVGFTDLATDRIGVCKLKDLDINPIKLGYINYSGMSSYITRTPARRFKQGLTNAVIRLPNGGAGRVHYASLANTIKGKYPSLKNCFSELLAGWQIIAFSREFAVNRDSQIYFKGLWRVGSIVEDKTYHVHPKFDWVRDVLEEQLEAA